MTTNQCPFCNQSNLADEKFCSACGSVLNLVPCPKCDAVNEKTAATCYRCHTEFKTGAADALRAPRETTQDAVLTRADLPVAESAQSTRQALVVLGIVLIAVTVASYYAYRQLPVTPSPGTTGIGATIGTTSGAASATDPATRADSGGISKKPDPSPGSRPPSPAGEITRKPEARPAVVVEPARVAAVPVPAEAASAPVGTTPPPVAPVPAPAAPAPAPVAAASAPPAVASAGEQSASPKPDPRRSRYSVAGGVDGGRTKPPAQCTEAIAALGLCTLKSNQPRQ